jgi:hypothetical protein
MVVAMLLACSAPPPPPAAGAPIPIEGQPSKLDLIDDKYLHYAIGEAIAAPPEVVWAVLTDAAGYPAWNSTVISLGGTIALGETISLVSRVDPERTFELEVTELAPAQRMLWEDGNNLFKGVRTFTLAPRSDGGTDFTMKEAFTGHLVGYIAPSLPDFGPDFDAFSADLAREAYSRVSATSEKPL